MSKSNEVMDQLGIKLVTEFASLFNDDGPGKNARMQGARDRIASVIRAAASIWANLEAQCESIGDLLEECAEEVEGYKPLAPGATFDAEVGNLIAFLRGEVRTARIGTTPRILELEAALSFEQLTAAHYGADLVTIVQLCGGDVEDGPSAARECVERLVAQAKAPHVRDTRRLKLRKGWSVNFPRDGMIHYGPNDSGCYDFGVNEDRVSRTFTAFHADGSETDHSGRLEAHDALIASGSESPFEVVTGVIPKAAVAE